METINVGKMSDKEFRCKSHSEQHSLMFHGIVATQETQNEILGMLNNLPDEFDKRYVKRSFLNSRITYAVGFVAGIVLTLKIAGLF